MASTEKNYDAIIVGGGHNGRVNGAYLAKAGLKVLIVERRHVVGGAAITEELRPGFHFTSFSYALSLLRPDIVQDLDLVRHGFMPILMPSSFAPSFSVIFIGCRGEAVVNSSSRVYSKLTARPVSRVARATRSSDITSCLPPNPPPTRLQNTRS